MDPGKALELVGRYSRLTLAIKACKPRIGACLDKCPGLKGFRLEVEQVPATIGFDGDVIDACEVPTERACAEQDTHLKDWYENPGEPEWDGAYRRFVVGEEQRAECEHCYAAHLIVRERRELRKQLAAVKGAMTRATTPQGATP